MASATNIVAVFVGTTTASIQESAAAVFTWDVSSSPAESTPTASSSEDHNSRTSSISKQSSTQSVLSSSSSSSNAVARQTDFSQQSPPAYYKPEATKQTPGLYISLIVLSTVIIVTALVGGWLAWRRYRQHHRKISGTGLERIYQVSSKSPPVLQKSAGRHSDTSDMTGPTLVSERDWHIAAPAYPVEQHHWIWSSEKNSALVNLSSGAARPDRELGPLEQPPTPPAKHNSRLPPTVPPSSPTLPKAMDTSRRSSRYQGAATHIRIPSPPLLELREFSPISPLSGRSD